MKGSDGFSTAPNVSQQQIPAPADRVFLISKSEKSIQGPRLLSLASAKDMHESNAINHFKSSARSALSITKVTLTTHRV